MIGQANRRPSVTEHAATELAEAGVTGPVAESVLTLAREFDATAPEGPQASSVADLFWKLANLRNLTPLGDSPGDWAPDPGLDGTLRHRRCPDLVRADGGPAVYTRALAFRDRDGAVWSGRCWADRDRTASVGSSLEVLSFPFMPRTFVLDAVRLPVGENAVEDFLADPGQLSAARSLYIIP